MKLSPTLKTTIVLAVIYIVGFLGLKFTISRQQSFLSAWGNGMAFVAWLFIFPIIAIIIIIAVMIMESIDAKRNKAKIDQK